MTTYYDHRAERTVAEAEAATRNAQAEALRAETALRLERERRQMDAEQAGHQQRARDERERSRTARRAASRRERADAKASRRRAFRRGAGALRAAVVRRFPVLVGGVAMGSPIAIAWNGQLEFAQQVMNLGILSPALPISLEGAVWYLAYLTHRAVTGTPPLPAVRYRLATWGLAAVAAGMNFWHGSVPKALPPGAPQSAVDQAARDASQTGVALALASLLGIALWELTVGLTQHTASKRSLTEIRRAAWRRLRYPRLSWQAASIRAARGDSGTVETAWTAAWIDRYGVGPDAPRRDRRLARKVVKYRSKADRVAAKSGRLDIRDGVIVGRPVADLAPPSPEGDKALENLRAFDSGSALRRALGRASLAVQTSRSDTPADTGRVVSPEVSLPVSPRVSLVPPLPPLRGLQEVSPDTRSDTTGDTLSDTFGVVSLRVSPEVSEDVPDDEVDAFITALRDTETDTGSDTESATASATDAMRRHWDAALADGRVATGPELAHAGSCAESYGRRMRRVWLDEMDGRTRRRLLGAAKKVTA